MAESFFDTPLGESLLSALDSRKNEDIAACVARVLEQVWKRRLSEDEVQEVVEKLQRRARYDDVVSIGDGAAATDKANITTRRRYSQALIEIGALHAAELELNSILEDADTDDKERGEARGLLGRVRKQRYIVGKRTSDLMGAIRFYNEAYAGGTDEQWHGVNLLAMMSRAQRDNEPMPPDLPDLGELTGRVLALVRQEPEDLRDIWARATEVESLVAMGNRVEARQVAEKLAESKRVNDFELNSLRRQLIEVWQFDDTDPVILAISDRQLSLGKGATLELPETAEHLEKILGTELPIGYNNLMMGLRSAESVCKMTDASGEGIGTGFLLKGSHIDPSLGDDPLLVTNAHVTSSIPGESDYQAAELQGRFEVTKGVDGEPLVLTGLTEAWTSAINRCDVTLLRFDGQLPKLVQPIEPAVVPPPITEDAFVYVIGHPAGAGVKFSIRGNDLKAYDGEMRRVHYMAPTEGGSSGSPVFNKAWQLMAVHHKGGERMRRLDDPSGTYKANEGITIEAIRKEFAANPPA